MGFVNESIIILVMILANAVFAAYEMALASISRTRLTYLVQTKKKGAVDALFMKDRMEASLAVVQLGITLVGAIAAAIGGAGITQDLNPYFQGELGLSRQMSEALSLIILIVPLSALTIIFAELIPKTYALKNNELVCLRLSGLMKVFTVIAYPFVSTLERIVKRVMIIIDKRTITFSKHDAQSNLHELTAAIALAKTSRLIDAQQEKIVLSAAQLSLRPVKDIIIPASDICLISITSSLSDALIRAHMDMHTRFPVCTIDGDPQTIQGYINFKDIMAALKINPEDPTIKGIIRPIKRFNNLTTISTVLQQMIHEKIHIGLVEDNTNQVVGLITLEDIIEELVGDIEDEFDRLPNYVHPYGNQWLMGGAVPMSLVAKTVGIEWPAVGGELKMTDWCQAQYGKPFNGGETINANGIQVTIKKLKRKRISEAFVVKK